MIASVKIVGHNTKAPNERAPVRGVTRQLQQVGGPSISRSVTESDTPVGTQRADAVERSEQNTELVNVRKQRAESQQVEAKYLDVLEAGQKIAEENDAMIARLDYRTVATHYVCAYKNDGYRVMEEMADRVPGVTYKESRTLSADGALGVGGGHIEISFADPDLAGWMRAHHANMGGD
mgnify:CR=1 FL=1